MSALLRCCISFKSCQINLHPIISSQKSSFRSWTSVKDNHISKQSLLYLRPRLFLMHPHLRKNSTDIQTNLQTNPKEMKTRTLWRRFRTPFILLQLTLSLGLAGIAINLYWRRDSHPAQTPELIVKDWEMLYFRVVPLRLVSRIWGWLTSRELPIWARQPVLGLYARTFNCNLDEAEDGNLENYTCLAEFFRRKLKNGARPIDEDTCLVSPSDGKVLHFGRVTAGMMEQVKGVSYSLSGFLGPTYWKNGPEIQSSSEANYEQSLLRNKDTDLYHCIIYLAPGDYHCFHSPVEWRVDFRRHFPGELFSVNPSVAKWLAGLFSLNERAVYVGEWAHGFFSMTLVGATNVGSIRVYQDGDMVTNCTKRSLPLAYYDRYMAPTRAMALQKGDIFGEFNLGSTIVLVFEAPKDFQFTVKAGDKISMGRGISCFAESSNL